VPSESIRLIRRVRSLSQVSVFLSDHGAVNISQLLVISGDELFFPFDVL
jgi:hypothetical protein